MRKNIPPDANHKPLPRHATLDAAGRAIAKAAAEYLRDAQTEMDPATKRDILQAFPMDLVGAIYTELLEVLPDILVQETMAILSHEARGCVTQERFDATIPWRLQYKPTLCAQIVFRSDTSW